jgi:signal peptidase I
VTQTRQRAHGPLRRFAGSFWGQLLIAFAVFSFVLSFVAKPYWVPSGSMEQTLLPGDRVLVDRLAYRNAEPRDGEVIVFEASHAWDGGARVDPSPLKAAWLWLGQWTGFGPSGDHTLVKRVIATPGQVASCCSADGNVEIDGRALEETYLFNDFPFTPKSLDCTTTPRSERCFGPVTVPKDSYLMLGDNRTNSSDSAVRCRSAEAGQASCWRWATRTGVVGRVVAIIWPIDRWRGTPR